MLFIRRLETSGNGDAQECQQGNTQLLQACGDLRSTGCRGDRSQIARGLPQVEGGLAEISPAPRNGLIRIESASVLTKNGSQVAIVMTRQSNIGWPLSGKSYRLLSGKSYRLYSPPKARSTSDRQRSAKPKRIGVAKELSVSRSRVRRVARARQSKQPSRLGMPPCQKLSREAAELFSSSEVALELLGATEKGRSRYQTL